MANAHSVRADACARARADWPRARAKADLAAHHVDPPTTLIGPMRHAVRRTLPHRRTWRARRKRANRVAPQPHTPLTRAQPAGHRHRHPKAPPKQVSIANVHTAGWQAGLYAMQCSCYSTLYVDTPEPPLLVQSCAPLTCSQLQKSATVHYVNRTYGNSIHRNFTDMLLPNGRGRNAFAHSVRCCVHGQTAFVGLRTGQTEW